MFSLQRVLGGDGEFFDLLETSADQFILGANALLELLKMPLDDHLLEPLAEIRHNNKIVTDKIHELLCRTFVTPIDREDIEKLAIALNRILASLEKFTERLSISRSILGAVDFSRQILILTKAAKIVREMVKDLRHSPEMAKVRDQNSRLQQLEGDADKLLLELMKDLYSGRLGPVAVQALSGLYELLEKAVDRCRDAGNVMVHMALKLN